MKMNGLFIGSAMFMGLLSGCASSYHAGGLKDVSSFPAVGNQKSVYVTLAYSGQLNGEPWKQDTANNKAFLEDTLFQSLEESGMISRVADREETADIKLLVAVINEKEKDTSNAILSACTLFLYPNTETDTFKLMAKVQHPKTGNSKTIKLEDSVVRRQQLLLGLLAPFKPHGKALESSSKRLMDNLVLEIQKSGMIK